VTALSTRVDPADVIRGGCPDGFWVRQNCDRAARFGLCSMTTIEDHRPSKLGRDAEPDRDEAVWLERRANRPAPAEQALADLGAALEQAKVRWDHGDAPYDPDLLALFRAAEKVIELFPDGVGQ